MDERGGKLAWCQPGYIWVLPPDSCTAGWGQVNSIWSGEHRAAVGLSNRTPVP